MDVKDVLGKGIELLKLAENEAPALEAGVILCHVLGKDRTYLYTHPEAEVLPEHAGLYFRFITHRAEGMPLQYITGNQEFMSLDFAVNSGVLIPRQDTEILVETVLQHVGGSTGVEILDIGTGSGCIAVSLAYYLGDCRVTAADISKDALQTARINAGKAKVDNRITFIESNLFENIHEKFDVIVSNPPYIRSDDIGTLQREVRDFEPLLALDGGAGGLDFYRRIIEKVPEFLKPKGLLAFETGFDQAAEVSEWMVKNFTDIKIIKDLSQKDRVVAGIFSPC